MNSSSIDKSQISKLCLIAGDGDLPIFLAENAIKSGVELIIFAVTKSNLNKLAKIAPVFSYSPFEVFKMLEKAKELKLEHTTFIGKVPKSALFTNLHKIDSRLIKRIKELENLNDDSLHFKILEIVEKEHGIKIIDQTLFLQDLFPGEAIFTKRAPNKEEIEEAKYGLQMAKGIAALDIGQTVVTQNKSVIAVESIEGTNACIKRSQKIITRILPFTKSKNFFVCKVSKPNQDKRFDVPTIGLGTIKAMPRNSILVFEAGEVFFPEQDKSILLANKKNICVFSLSLNS